MTGFFKRPKYALFVVIEILQIRKEFEEKVKILDPIGKMLKFHLDDEVILINGSGGQNLVTDLDEEADCTISMSKETYLKLQRGELKPMIATLTGEIKVKGDLGVAQKLKQLM